MALAGKERSELGPLAERIPMKKRRAAGTPPGKIKKKNCAPQARPRGNEEKWRAAGAPQGGNEEKWRAAGARHVVDEERGPKDLFSPKTH